MTSGKDTSLEMNDLSKKSLSELKELLTRQNNILLKPNFVAKLPDQGRKLYQVQVKLVEEIRRRGEEASQCEVDKKVRMSAVQSMEWTGNYTLNSEQAVDSDDDSADETDVMKILSSQAGAGMYKKQYRYKPPEASLIRPEDLQDIAEPNDSNPIEPYADRLCHRDESSIKNTKESYKPYKTVITHSGPVSSKKVHPRGPCWENTAATFPDYVHDGVKPVSLAESLQLQKAYADHIEELQESQASARLTAQIERMTLDARIDSPPESVADEIEVELECADEVTCEEEHDDGGFVNYTISE